MIGPFFPKGLVVRSALLWATIWMKTKTSIIVGGLTLELVVIIGIHYDFLLIKNTIIYTIIYVYVSNI